MSQPQEIPVFCAECGQLLRYCDCYESLHADPDQLPFDTNEPTSQDDAADDTESA